MRPFRLTILMQKLVRQLVCKENQSHFSNAVLPLLLPTGGNVRFVWQINSKGSWLYLYDMADWEQTLLDRITEYRSHDISNIYYLYDKQKLLPIFENDVRYIAKKRIEVRGKKSIKQIPCREEQ